MSNKKIAKLLPSVEAYMQRGQHALAKQVLEKILKLDPNHLPSLINLGLCEYGMHHYQDAAQKFHHLHKSHPENFDINKWAGVCYLSCDQYDLAFQFLVRALKVKPKDLFVLHAITKLLMNAHRETDAIYYATEAVSSSPASPDAHNILGGCLMEINRFQDALTCFETAILLDPNHFAANSNRANVLERMRHFEASVMAYRDCLKLTKSQTEAHEIRFKMSLPLLASGQLEEGWASFEHGLLYADSSSRNPKRVFKIPQWQGESLKGKTILLWREQGLGDEVDHCVLVPRLIELADKVIIECNDRLVNLLSRSFPSCLVREQSFDPDTKQSNFFDYDYHLPLGSLAKFFLKQKDDFALVRPYMQPDPELVLHFKKRLSQLSSHHTVGVCWRSGLNTSSRNQHYTPISAWEPILKLPNLTFVNLQYGDAKTELENVAKHFNVRIVNFDDVDLKNDIESVCAIIQALDCVVSAGTSVACLTGAVGTKLKIYSHRVWALLGQDFRPWSRNTDLYLTQAETGYSFAPVLQHIADDLAREFP
jgi:tetratricopeptide (TPR) repeat protein